VFKYIPFGYQDEYKKISRSLSTVIAEDEKPVISGWSVGLLGYYLHDYSVINIEGLASNYDFFLSTKSRSILINVCKYKIDYILQHFASPNILSEDMKSLAWLTKLRVDQLNSVRGGISQINIYPFSHGYFYIFKLDREYLGCQL
jgi:hypothetical protein